MSDEYSAQVDAPGIFQPKDVDDDDDDDDFVGDSHDDTHDADFDDDDDANGHDIVDDNNDAVFDWIAKLGISGSCKGCAGDAV